MSFITALFGNIIIPTTIYVMSQWARHYARKVLHINTPLTINYKVSNLAGEDTKTQKVQGPGPWSTKMPWAIQVLGGDVQASPVGVPQSLLTAEEEMLIYQYKLILIQLCYYDLYFFKKSLYVFFLGKKPMIHSFFFFFFF